MLISFQPTRLTHVNAEWRNPPEPSNGSRMSPESDQALDEASLGKSALRRAAHGGHAYVNRIHTPHFALRAAYGHVLRVAQTGASHGLGLRRRSP
jgi:hypothetical protein